MENLVDKLGTLTGEVLPCDNCLKTAPLVFAGWADEFCEPCWEKRQKRARRKQNDMARELAGIIARALAE